MKKYLILGFLLVGLFFAPTAKADIVSDLQAQIVALTQQVSRLQMQNQLLTIQLQIAQLRLGTTCSAGQTYNWQTGVLCSGTGTTTSQISVISPNGGETWQRGKTYTISFYQPSTTSATRVYLDQYYPAKYGKTGINSSYLITTVSPGVQSASYTVPTTVALGTTNRIRACSVSTLVCDSSDNYFTITDTSIPTNPTLSVSVDPATPAAQTLAPGQNSVPVAVIDLRATGGDVLINQISVGVTPATGSALADSIDIYDGSTLLGSVPHLGNYNPGQNNQWGSVNISTLKIPANSTKALTLKADISPNVSGSFKAGIVGLAYPVPTPYDINGWSGFGNPMTVSTSSSTQLFTALSAVSPAARVVTTSSSAVTPDVVLGVYSLKVTNQNGTLNGVRFNLNLSGNNSSNQVFQNIRLVDQTGNLTYGASYISGDMVNFANLNSTLPANLWRDFTLKADVLSGVNGIASSPTLVGQSLIGVDSNYLALSTTTASDITANSTSFTLGGISLSNASATLGNYTMIPSGSTSVVSGQQVTFNFTLTNTGSTPVYVPKNVATFVATSSSGGYIGSGSTASSTLYYAVAAPSLVTGDEGAAWIIPASSSRAFTLSGVVSKNAGSSPQTLVLKITGVYYYSNPAYVVATSSASTITTNLTALSVSPTALNNTAQTLELANILQPLQQIAGRLKAAL